MLTLFSTTVTATQTIGILSALCLYTTNELWAGPILLALGCVMAYRAVVILLVFWQDAFKMCMIPGPVHLYLFILYYGGWDFFLHNFDYNINYEDLNLWMLA
jgi:hypothetical protein